MSDLSIVAETDLKTRTGVWHLRVYKDLAEETEHVAMIKGVIVKDCPTLVRVHSECLTGDVLGSLQCDCGEQVRLAMEQIAREGVGVFLYMRKQEGRGIGLSNKIRAYDLQRREGLDTVEANLHLGFPADSREYHMAAQILAGLGINKIRLMTNNPKKLVGLKEHGVEVIEQIPLEVPGNGVNNGYLRTKKEKMGHWLVNV